MMDTGLHQTGTEESIEQNKKAFWIQAGKNMDWLLCINAGINAGAIGVTGTAGGGFGIGAVVGGVVVGMITGAILMEQLMGGSRPPPVNIPLRP